MLGDPRTNQNPAFLTLGILFYRWHNVLASRISRAHPKWKDEDVFQESGCSGYGQHSKIVFLPRRLN